MDAVALDRIGKRPHDVFLADHLVEAQRAVTAVERRLSGHCGECIQALGGAAEGKDMERLSARGVLSLALTGALCLCLGAVATARLKSNPANHRSLIDKPIEAAEYDRGKGCRDHPPAGMLAFEDWLQKNIRGETWGIMRCESWAAATSAFTPRAVRSTGISTRGGPARGGPP